MSDLIERLRRAAIGSCIYEDADACVEAAAEIERLRATRLTPEQREELKRLGDRAVTKAIGFGESTEQWEKMNAARTALHTYIDGL